MARKKMTELTEKFKELAKPIGDASGVSTPNDKGKAPEHDEVKKKGQAADGSMLKCKADALSELVDRLSELSQEEILELHSGLEEEGEGDVTEGFRRNAAAKRKGSARPRANTTGDKKLKVSEDADLGAEVKPEFKSGGRKGPKSGSLDDTEVADDIKRTKDKNLLVKTEDYKTDEDEDDDKKKKTDEELALEIFDRIKIKVEDVDLSTHNPVTLLDGNELSEEFKTQISELFGAAVVATTNARLKTLASEEVKHIREATDTATDELAESLDKYLDYVAENFFEENQIAIESSLKVERAETFLAALSELFVENNIDVPTEKRDLVSELETRADTAEKAFAEEMKRNVKLREDNQRLLKEKVVEDVASDLSDVQREKLMELVENLTFKDADSFTSKVNELKTKYITESKEEKAPVLTESKTPVASNGTDNTVNMVKSLLRGNRR